MPGSSFLPSTDMTCPAGSHQRHGRSPGSPRPVIATGISNSQWHDASPYRFWNHAKSRASPALCNGKCRFGNRLHGATASSLERVKRAWPALHMIGCTGTAAVVHAGHRKHLIPFYPLNASDLTGDYTANAAWSTAAIREAVRSRVPGSCFTTARSGKTPGLRSPAPKCPNKDRVARTDAIGLDDSSITN